MQQSDHADLIGKLTPREREVALLVAEGAKDILIARRLDLSLSTVRTYIQRIKARLDLSSRGEIAGWVATRRAAGHPDVRL